MFVAVRESVAVWVSVAVAVGRRCKEVVGQWERTTNPVDLEI